MTTGRTATTVAGLALVVASILFAAPVSATSPPTTDESSDSPTATAAPGPRPTDRDVECVVGSHDIVEVPAPQQRLDPDTAWIVSRGAGVTVAVLDSGVDPSHPQLAGQVDDGIDIVVPGSTGNADCLGQGTAVAGLIVALPVEGVGLHGMAPAARIFPVRVVEDDLASTPSAIASGILAAVDADVRVILVTLSTPARSNALDEAVAAAVAAGVLVIAPVVAGTDPPGFAYPGAYDDVLTVGAVDAAGESMDQSLDLPPVADLVAPGVGAIGTLPQQGHTAALTGSVPAAAYVAGVAALVWSAYPDLSAGQVRERLEATADRPGTQAPDPLLGWGVVNADIALTAIIPAESRDDPAKAAALVVPAPGAPVIADRTTANRAIWIFAIGAVIAMVMLIAVAVVPRGRRTGWRPTRSSRALPPSGA